jgi:hypothetical protein
MSAATQATTARKRATIALEMIVRYRHDRFYGMSRAFDDCFEMNDGDEVIQHGLRSLEHSPRYRAAVLGEGRTCSPVVWIRHAENIEAILR